MYPGFGPCECADPPPPPPPQPWYAVLNDGLTKVRPGSSISSPVHQVTLDMASNEFEAFQLIVRPPTGVALENFRLTLNDLGVGASSLKANGGRITIYREEVINLGTRSGPDGDIGAWPDALIPAFDEVYNQRRNAFDVVAADGSSIPITIPGTAGTERVYYVEVYLPLGHYFGTITGTLTATWNVGSTPASFTVPVTVRQNTLTLPSTSSLRTFYNMGWTGLCNRLFNDPDCVNPEMYGVQESFIQYMLDHRLSARLGWLGAREPRDLNAFATHYGRFLDGSSAPRADGATVLPGAKLRAFVYEPQWMTGEVGDPVVDPPRYAEWRAFMEGRGWFSDASGTSRTFDYTCDEPGNAGSSCPDPTVIPGRGDAVHALTADFSTLVVKPNQNKSPATPPVYCGVDPYINTYSGDINVGVANSTHVFDSAEANAFLDMKMCPMSTINQVWWYQSCNVHDCSNSNNTDLVGMPSLMIDVGCNTSPCSTLVSGAQNRAMQWFTYYYGFAGELYYDSIHMFNVLSQNPWEVIMAFGGNGDGTLLYPWDQTHVGGSSKVPVASLRLKMLRDGMEDYEYLKQLDELCPMDARAFVEELFGVPVDTRHANVSVASFYDIRNQIAQRIADLRNGSLCGGPSGTCPPGQTNCGGVCRDLSSSLSNCGVCGRACSGQGLKCWSDDHTDWWYAGQVCTEGQCVSNSCDPL